MKGQEMTLCRNLLVCLMVVSGCDQRQMDTTIEPGRKGYTEAAVALTVERVTMSSDGLNLCYQIRNNSEEDIWFCDDMDAKSPIDFETVTSRDGETLFIRMRLDMPDGWWHVYTRPYGRYRRLASGEVHRGALWLACPVQRQPVLTSRSAHHQREVKEARFLVLEIGYCCGDLPGGLLDILREAAEEDKSFDADLGRLRREIGGLEKELEQLTGAQQRTETAKTIERLQRQEDRLQLLRESGRLYMREYLFDNISDSLMFALEECRSQFDGTANETWVPYLYARDAGGEYLLSATVRNVAIPHVPPRYLDFEKPLPWGRRTANSEGALTCEVQHGR